MNQSESCDLIARAIALQKSGDGAQAMQELHAALATNGDNGRQWELLGLLAYANEDYRLALRAIETANSLVPLGASGQVVLARCYDRFGFRASARAIYGHLAEQRRGLPAELLEPVAAGLGRNGEYELALNVCRLAAERSPENAEPLLAMVQYMRRLRRPVEQVLPVLFRAHHLEPENVECRITLAWLLHEAGRSEEGAYLLRPVAADDSSCIRCLTLMQCIFESVGDDDGAQACQWRLTALASERPPRDEAYDPTLD